MLHNRFDLDDAQYADRRWNRRVRPLPADGRPCDPDQDCPDERSRQRCRSGLGSHDGNHPSGRSRTEPDGSEQPKTRRAAGRTTLNDPEGRSGTFRSDVVGRVAI